MAISLDEFCEWAIGTGQVSNPNGSYPGQCVSLIQQYLYRCYDIPYAPRGNAKDFMPPRFHRVGDAPRPGDIIRYGANYGGGFGHIGMINADGLFLDQNGTIALRVALRHSPFRGYQAIFRPDALCRLRPTVTRTNGQRIEQHGTYRATDRMNIRRQPSLNGQTVGTLGIGQTVQYDSYIDANGYRWISYVGYSGNRNYIARRNFSTGSVYGLCY